MGNYPQKKGKGKLPIFFGNGERVISVYGSHPRCPDYDMFVPWAALNWRHSDTALCTRGTERKHRRLAEQDVWEGGALSFKASDQPLTMVSLLHYLGQNLSTVDNDWLAVVANLRRARKV